MAKRKNSLVLLDRYHQSRNPWHRQWLLGSWILAQIRRRRGGDGRQPYGAEMIDEIASDAAVSRATAYKAKKIAERFSEAQVLSTRLSAESAYALASLDSAQSRRRALAEIKRRLKAGGDRIAESEAMAVIRGWAS